MAQYFKGFAQVNADDLVNEVASLQSTESEKKKIIKVRISKETNAGYMTLYVDRENLFEGNTSHRTAQATVEDFLEFPIDRELEIGEVFKIFLQNVAAGVNAELSGDIVYEIL